MNEEDEYIVETYSIGFLRVCRDPKDYKNDYSQPGTLITISLFGKGGSLGYIDRKYELKQGVIRRNKIVFSARGKGNTRWEVLEITRFGLLLHLNFTTPTEFAETYKFLEEWQIEEFMDDLKFQVQGLLSKK